MTVCIITLGCKVNHYESGQLAAKYLQNGYEVIQKFTPKADLYIINTCAVTAFAEKKSRYWVSHIRRANPGANIIVCGCASQLNPEQFQSMNVIEISGCGQTKEWAFQSRKRAFVKVQDGCNNFCSYCIVPHLRGRSRSRSIADIISELRECNPKPIVLTGIDLSSFGLDIGTNLGELCKEVNSLGRPFELSSMEVHVITTDFLNILRDCNNFIPKFHLPLQSASDNVLHAMGRKYTAEEYLEKAELIRKFFPDAILTTDIIAGFPTESDEDFAQTLEFVKKIHFANVHIFPYSKRSGTAAAELGELPSNIVTNRCKKLNFISAPQ